ncbi:MAG: alpha/beta hydrolase [Actinomycetota bacterium]
MRKMASIDDVEICYERMGSGPPLVMIMGYTANMDWWSPLLLEVLSSRYAVTVFDNRGAGRSGAGCRRFSIKQFASDTAGLMKVLGIERAHVLGVSMGGMIAQQLALDFPLKVDRLVLCCTVCGGPEVKPPALPVLRRLVDFSGSAEDRIRRSADVLYPREYLEEHPDVVENAIGVILKAMITPRNAYRQAGAILGFRTHKRLPALFQETLVMCGEEDVLVPPANSDTLVSRIPGATMRRFSGAGHGFTTQCAADVAQAVVGFLSGQTAPVT